MLIWHARKALSIENMRFLGCTFFFKARPRAKKKLA